MNILYIILHSIFPSHLDWMEDLIVVAGTLILVFSFLLIRRNLRLRSALKDAEKTGMQQQFFEQLIENMPDRIYFKDRESRFIFASKTTSNIVGMEDPASIVGKTDHDVYDKKYANDFYADEQRIMESGEPMIQKEEKGLDINGNEIFVSTTKIPVRNENNEVIGIIGIGRDISPQKATEKELHQKSTALSELNRILKERNEKVEKMALKLDAQATELRDANYQLKQLSLVASYTGNVVIIMDGNGKFEWVNEAFEKKYIQTLEEFIKEKGENIRESSSYDNIDIILNQISITRESFIYNSKSTTPKGDTIWNQTNIFPVTDTNNEITNLILIDSDITELKLAEEEIKKKNSKIKKTSKDLEHINKMKDRLFSIIAHDLKSPFQAIFGFTELLQIKHDKFSKDELLNIINMIRQASDSAYQLLENLLEWGNTQTGRVKYKPVNLNMNMVINESISILAPSASKKDVIIQNDVDDDIYVFADSNMLHTIIRNLTSNAIKYSNEGGKVSFTGRKSNEQIIIKITDTGIGIKKERLASLFQLDNMESTRGTSNEKGTGLGLVITEEFIKINKGSIDAESTEGKGTTFTITLPSGQPNMEKTV